MKFSAIAFISNNFISLILMVFFIATVLYYMNYKGYLGDSKITKNDNKIKSPNDTFLFNYDIKSSLVGGIIIFILLISYYFLDK